MLRRCYSEREHARHPTYIGCSVCEDWLTFSKFRKWMVRQDGYWERKDGEMKTNQALSHSVHSRDNKLYSPETSFFVPMEVVNLFTDSAAARGDLPLGVTWDKRVGKYQARLDMEGTQKFIGLYDTAAEAHRAWLSHKRAYVLLTIDKLLPANVPYHATVREKLIARAHEEYADVEPAAEPAPAAAAPASKGPSGPSAPPRSLPGLPGLPRLTSRSPHQRASFCTSAVDMPPSEQQAASERESQAAGERRKLIYDVGTNDADYRVIVRTRGPDGKITSTWTCPYYRRWRNMLERCYSPTYHARNPTYICCSVCEDWLTFSKFRKWMVRQDGHWERKDGEWKSMQALSHSVHSRDNKLYSPETSFFVPMEVTALFNDSAAARGDYPLGVYWNKSKGKFKAKLKVEGEEKYIGLYDTAAEAHRAWLSHKRAYVLLLIDKHLPATVPYHATVREKLIARAHEEYADVEPAAEPAPAAAAPPAASG